MAPPKVGLGNGKPRTHGMSYTPTYASWAHMRGRCENPNNEKYPRYGGRGIKVCDRWKSFENFLADMGEKPPGTTLDRWPDNDGNYEPGNCRWATQLEQQRNRSRSHRIIVDGQVLSTVEYAERFGLSKRTARRRLAAQTLT